MTTTSAMKGSAKTCFGDIKTLNTFLGNQYLNVNVGGKRRSAVEAKQKWTHDYYVKRMKKLVYVVLLWVCLVRYLVIHSPWYDTVWT